MFTYETPITLRDADGAGVLFFARYFALAHDAYEAFMAARGLSTAQIIGATGYVVPVVHAEADYRRPLALGERATVRLEVAEVKRRSFTVRYELLTESGETAAKLHTVHVAVDKESKRAVPLPDELVRVLQPGGA